MLSFLSKGTLAAVAMVAGVFLSALSVIGSASPIPVLREPALETLALAPISLGNPTAAATLRTRQPDTPMLVRYEPTGMAYSFTVRPESGDTLAQLLVKSGVNRTVAHEAITALGTLYDPRRIRIGQEIMVRFHTGPEGETPGRFLGLSLEPDPASRITIARLDPGGFEAARVDKVLTRRLTLAEGTIDHSLYLAGTRSELPRPVLHELIRAFSWDVDFQRDIRAGDSFRVLYEHFHDAEGRLVRTGRILFAALRLSGDDNAVYRHQSRDGTTGYYGADGRSVQKALLRTPVDGARLSSGYGRRKHPILGFTRMHRGIDFAAPRGTPVYAAGSGRIDVVGRRGAYGKYVRIRHDGEYSTAYAHLSRYAKGLAKGQRVSQGRVIGYVGSTGRSTGAHLHYEILRAGRRINPMKVRLPSGRRLAGAELERFLAAREARQEQIASLAHPPRLTLGE